jgi:hypothetical protein
MSTSGLGRGESTVLATDGRWSWVGHTGVEIRGRLETPRFARFRALLATAELGAEITCEAGELPERDRKMVTVSDYERERHATYVEPCIKPDPATTRLLECLDVSLQGSDSLFDEKCIVRP